MSNVQNPENPKSIILRKKSLQIFHLPIISNHYNEAILVYLVFFPRRTLCMLTKGGDPGREPPREDLIRWPCQSARVGDKG